MELTRRELISHTVRATALVATTQFFHWDAFAASKYDPIQSPLDSFVESYMRAMNSPGLTLSLSDRDGVQRVTTYGFSDKNLNQRVQPAQLFEIGSITKSFLALLLLQLKDEGKLNLHRSVLDYMPWLKIDSNFPPITVHHFLTHSSGLPSAPLFLSDPAARHHAAHAPGEHFHYNNMAFAAMGYLLESLDGQPFSVAVRKRIFEPLGMTETEPVITFDVRQRLAKNYIPYLGDRPYPREGALAEAPQIVMTDTAGCIASTPRDMALYMQMLASGGRTKSGRLVFEESFALFSTPHIKAEEFGQTASYGYGIAVDTLEGHKVIRHTGGMVSFASAMQIDLDSGVGAFASINAMQGYRPNPVAQYAIQLMRALSEGKPLPAAPEIKGPRFIANASDYAGTFTSPEGRKLEFIAQGDSVHLQTETSRIPLELKEPDKLLHPGSKFTFVFSRANEKDPKSAVVELGHGNDWYTTEKYSGPKAFNTPKEWNTFLGHYRSENAWNGSFRVISRKGQLMLDGVVPLEPAGNFFYLRDEPHSPEWISFHDVINGKAMRVKLSGDDFWRVDAE